MENKAFDKILKENMEAVFLPLAQKFLGFKVKSSRALPEKLQTTLEREPDFIRIVQTDDLELFILHLEFQTTNDPEMVYRQAEYRAILQRKFKIPVKQFVIYLGLQRPNMETRLPEDQEIKGFEIKSIHEYDYKELVISEIPEEIILAVLANSGAIPPEKVILEILFRLKAVSKSEMELKKYISQLNILSRLRKLETLTTKIADTMPISYDIETDGLYQAGIEKGIEKGMEKGIEKGMERKSIEIALALLAKGKLAPEEVSEITGLPIDKILALKENM